MSGEIQPMVDGGQQLFLPTMALNPELAELAAIHRDRQEVDAEWSGCVAVINTVQQIIAEEYRDQVLEPRRHIWSRLTDHLKSAPIYRVSGSSKTKHYLEWRFRQYAQQENIEFAVDTEVKAERYDETDEAAIALDALVRITLNGNVESVAAKNYPLTKDNFGKPEIIRGLRRHWSEEQLRRGLGELASTGIKSATFLVEATPLGTNRSSRISYTSIDSKNFELTYTEPPAVYVGKTDRDNIGSVLNPKRAIQSLDRANKVVHNIERDYDDYSYLDSLNINETLRAHIVALDPEVYDGKSWFVGSQFEKLLKIDDVLAKSQPIYRS